MGCSGLYNSFKAGKEVIMRRTFFKWIIVNISITGFLLYALPVLSASEIDLGAGLTPKPGAMKTLKDQFKKAPPWRIAISMPGAGNSWIVQMFEETKYAASKEKRISEFVVADAEWNPAKQVADLEDLLTKNVDAIIVWPVTPTSLGAIVDKIAARGVAVITAGPIEGTNRQATEFTFGRDAFGRVGGEFLLKELKGKGTVWMIRGVAGVAEEEFRYQGAVSAFEGTDIKIGAEVYADWSYAKGKQVCENLIMSGKPVDGIWSSGAESTKGCLEAFQEFKKPLVPMTAECSNGFIRVWKETGVKSVLPIYPSPIGQATVRAAVALLEGIQLYKDYISVLPPITEENRDEYYRPDLSDNFWVPCGLPEAKIQELYGKKK
jgi:ribose transport system substrate-binding protein